MAREGMDSSEVDSLGHQLQGQADQIEAAMNAIDGLINKIPSIWWGKDATDHVSWWQQQHRPALKNVRDAIHGLGQSAINNARDQMDVSNR